MSIIELVKDPLFLAGRRAFSVDPACCFPVPQLRCWRARQSGRAGEEDQRRQAQADDIQILNGAWQPSSKALPRISSAQKAAC